MAEAATKLPVKTEDKKTEATAMQAWQPFESLRREVDRLFENFDRDLWRSPFSRSVFDIAPHWRRELKSATSPAVDIVEKDNAYEVTAELPGMDEKDIDVSLTRDSLTIRGEKKEEKEEKGKDFYRMERSYGSFTRSVPLPVEVETDKVVATFKKGVLNVTLPKSPKAIQETKKVSVKAS